MFQYLNIVVTAVKQELHQYTFISPEAHVIIMNHGTKSRFRSQLTLSRLLLSLPARHRTPKVQAQGHGWPHYGK
jgi:hypothetical protein